MVSIILPTYNRAALLPATIRSVLQQSYTGFELLIMDDGSEDQTKELVMNFGDSRIKYFQLPHSGHTGRSKNLALQHASGTLIAFIDSDDLWEPRKLERQVSLLSENPSIGFSLTDVTTFRGDIVLIEQSYKLRNTVQCVNIFDWLKESRFLVYNPTLVIRKSCFGRVGYFDESMLSGDYHFNMRLAFYFSAGIIYEPLVKRRVHDSNMSEQIPFENYREYISTFEYLHQSGMITKKYLRQAKSIAFYKMGKLSDAKKEPATARLYYLSSLKNNLFQRACYIRLLQTFV